MDFFYQFTSTTRILDLSMDLRSDRPCFLTKGTQISDLTILPLWIRFSSFLEMGGVGVLQILSMASWIGLLYDGS